LLIATGRDFRFLSQYRGKGLFFPAPPSYRGPMSRIFGWMPSIVAAMSQGPWGGKGSGSGGGEPEGNEGSGDGSGGPRNPWTQKPVGNRPTGQGPSAIDELIRRGRESFGGGGFGGGFPQGPGGRAIWPIALGLLALIWLALTSVHRVGPQERGVVTMLGKYSRTLSPGISLTLPAPFETVETVDVEEIRTIDIGSASADSENLVLTGDQNIIDLAYSVRGTSAILNSISSSLPIPTPPSGKSPNPPCVR
jgi:membrane protease subunit HflK